MRNNIFSSLLTIGTNKLECMSLASHSSLVCHFWGLALTLHENIRLGWKNLLGTLAYFVPKYLKRSLLIFKVFNDDTGGIKIS